jgi:hypothetical protein
LHPPPFRFGDFVFKIETRFCAGLILSAAGAFGWFRFPDENETNEQTPY